MGAALLWGRGHDGNRIPQGHQARGRGCRLSGGPGMSRGWLSEEVARAAGAECGVGSLASVNGTAVRVDEQAAADAISAVEDVAH